MLCFGFFDEKEWNFLLIKAEILISFFSLRYLSSKN